MLLIDTHAHVNFNAYREDGEAVIKRALKNGIWLINVGSQYSTSRRAIEFAQKYPEGVYAAVGVHPVHLKEQVIYEEVDSLEEFEFKTRPETFDFKKYEELAGHKKVVAIGEVGLDYFHLQTAELHPAYNRRGKRGTDTRPPAGEAGNNAETMEEQKKKQKENFIKHLELAEEVNKPVIIHCREAHNDVLEILKNFPACASPMASARRAGSKNNVKGVVHSFSGRWSQAEEYFELGFYISFNGLITFARDYDKVIKNAPLERLMLETDCPYLTPVPHRGKRNEPSYVKYVAEKIAEIKGISLEEVAEATTRNARELFGI